MWKNLLAKESINFISLVCAIGAFLILLLYWDQFNWTKRIIFITIAISFMTLLGKNSKQLGLTMKSKPHINKLNLEKFGYQQQSDAHQNFKSKRLKNIFNNLNNIKLDQDIEQERGKYNYNETYSRVQRNNPYENVNQVYNMQDVKQERISRINPREIDYEIPPNIPQKIKSIGELMSPMKYFKMFCIQVEKMRMKMHQNEPNLQTSSNSRSPHKIKQPREFYNVEKEYSSFKINKNRKLLIAENYDVLITDEIYCMETLSEIIEEKMTNILDKMEYTLKQLSNIIDQCFGVKLNFGRENQNLSKNSKSMSMNEIKEIIYRMKKNDSIPLNFTLQMSIRQFTKSFLPKLQFLYTEAQFFLNLAKNQQTLSFSMYINILKKQFPHESIETYSETFGIRRQSLEVKHFFYLNESIDIYFTYNRIPDFKTRNPLVILLAFFMENFKLKRNRESRWVASMNRFFIQNKP